MFRYILKRILFAALALFILLILAFFLMQAIPGYPIEKSSNQTYQEYLVKLQGLGLLDNPIVQFGNFIEGIFVKGEFGQVFNGNKTVIATALNPMKYTIIVAFPAFILSSIIGIGLGIVAAKYRGKAADVVVNVIGVLFLAVPSFILALYLVKFAGVIGLPTQFIPPGSGTVSQQIRSLIMPILAMTLSSISTIMYYTRNEMVDIFKQDYIKTALAKGVSFNKIIFTHAFRNALIPILAILGPSFIGVLSGSIIVEKFFNIPGSSSILVNAIQGKEIYVVVFCVLFYSGIYFLMQILIDVSFSLIDPRIKIASKDSNSLIKILKMKRQKGMVHNSAFKGNFNYFKTEKSFASLDTSTQSFYLDYFTEETLNEKYREFLVSNTDEKQLNLTKTSYQNLLVAIKESQKVETVTQKVSIYQKMDLPTESDIESAKQMISPVLQHTEEYQLSNFLTTKVKKESFRFKKGLSYNNEQIVGKPSTYWKDVFTRFFKSKASIVFTIILLGIILLGLVFSLAYPNATSVSIGGLSSNIVAYLPPRIPFLGVSGAVSEKIVSNEVYIQLQQIAQSSGLKLFDGAEAVGSSWKLINYNPYVLPQLKNVYPLMGTDGLGRDWWNMMWYSTIKSLTLAIIASAGSVIIGTIYGAIAGTFAGKWVDTLLMRIVEIISSIPTIIWVMIISIAVSGGTLDIFTICFTLIITSWMGTAIMARTFVVKYKDAEFVQAAQTLGASKMRIIFTHLLPNIFGRLLVVFVNRIPTIIYFETSLVFLGLKSSGEVSLGTMINTAYLDGYWWLIVGPTLTLVLTTLSTMMISNNLSDSLDPKIVN